jgi:hypothetical protein
VLPDAVRQTYGLRAPASLGSTRLDAIASQIRFADRADSPPWPLNSAKPEIVGRLFTSKTPNPTLSTVVKLAEALGLKLQLAGFDGQLTARPVETEDGPRFQIEGTASVARMLVMENRGGRTNPPENSRPRLDEFQPRSRRDVWSLQDALWMPHDLKVEPRMRRAHDRAGGRHRPCVHRQASRRAPSPTRSARRSISPRAHPHRPASSR